MIKKDTLCIIPARSGSKGIKNKNIIKFRSYPLLKYSIDFANKLKFVKKIIVSTDSQRYLNISKKYLVTTDKLRPKSLSKDNTKTIDVVRFEYLRLKDNKIKKILILQPTCPFRKINDFYKANKAINKGYESAITINKVTEYPQRMLIKNKNNLFVPYLKNTELFIPRQKIYDIYIRSGSMYFFHIKNLKKKNFLGNQIFTIETFGKYMLNIDSYKDIIIAKHYFNENYKN